MREYVACAHACVRACVRTYMLAKGCSYLEAATKELISCAVVYLRELYGGSPS